MLRLLSDENFNGAIVRGLKFRLPDVDLVRVQDVGLQGMDDPDILAWAAENNRIVLTHDRSTFGNFAYARLIEEKVMPGVFVNNARSPVAEIVEELVLLMVCSKQTEWNGQVVHLPL